MEPTAQFILNHSLEIHIVIGLLACATCFALIKIVTAVSALTKKISGAAATGAAPVVLGAAAAR